MPELRTFDVAVEFMIRFGLASRLLAAHVPNERGRCKACTAPGYGTPHEMWPCVVHTIAASAADAASTR